MDDPVQVHPDFEETARIFDKKLDDLSKKMRETKLASRSGDVLRYCELRAETRDMKREISNIFRSHLNLLVGE